LVSWTRESGARPVGIRLATNGTEISTMNRSMRIVRVALGVALLGIAPACGPKADPATAQKLEDLGVRLASLEAKLASLEAGVGAAGPTAERLDALERRVEEASKANLEMYDDCIDQILKLRDHVTLQLGKLRMESESERIRKLATAGTDQLAATLREGGIELDLPAKTLRVRGAICLTEGLVEFLAVGHGGKDHESLLYLECTPSLLNAGLLALGLEPGKPYRIEPEGPDAPEGGIRVGPEDEGLLYYPPTGPKVFLQVEWEAEGTKVSRRAEDLLLNRLTGATMERAGWVYLGSRFAPADGSGREVYVADVTRDMISIWHSYMGNTVLDSPLPEGMEDDVFVVNRDAVPPRGTPVDVVFSLEPKVQ